MTLLSEEYRIFPVSRTVLQNYHISYLVCILWHSKSGYTGIGITLNFYLFGAFIKQMSFLSCNNTVHVEVRLQRSEQ